MEHLSTIKNSMLILVLLAILSMTVYGDVGKVANNVNKGDSNGGGEFLGLSAELQSVNSYLTGIESISMEPSVVVQHLEEALSLIESVGDEVVQTGVDSETVDASIRCLFGNNPDSLKSILDSLIEASKACNEETTRFLTLVKNQTFAGQFLNDYSERLVSVCHVVQANLVADRVERSLGKVGAEVYELMADLAHAYVARDKKTSASRGNIVISDNEKSHDPKEIVRTLKQIKLDSAVQQKLFATMIRNYYAEEFPTEQGVKATSAMRKERLTRFVIDSLITPCQEVTRRWIGTVNSAEIKEISRRLIAETIEGRRNDNISLDKSLEMVRICRKLQDKSNALLSLCVA